MGRAARGRRRAERPDQRRRAGVRGAAGQGARRENRARASARREAPARGEPDALLGDAARAQSRASGAGAAHRGDPARGVEARRARDRQAARRWRNLGMRKEGAMAAPGNMRSAIVTAAVMIAGSLAWIAGISLSGLEGSRGFFGAGPLIADANLILEVFLVAGITYGFLLARRGNIEAHQINQTTWVVLNLGLIALVMAGLQAGLEIRQSRARAP